MLLDRKNQPHIGVGFVPVEPVLAALVEGDHVGAQAGLVLALLFDGRNLGIASLERLGLVTNVLGCALHPRGHVFHADQHVNFEIGRLHLSLRRGRIKAVAQIVVLGGRVFLQLATGHVVIGKHQAVGADERARPAVVQPHAGEAQMVQPCLAGMEVIFGRQLLERWVVKGPHAFFGVNHRRGSQQQGGGQQQGEANF